MRALRILPLLVLFATAPATAAPILSVTGAGGDVSGSQLTLYGDALAGSFQLNSGFINVSLGVSLSCTRCQAEFFLIQNAIGPAANFVANLLAVTTVDTLAGGGFVNAPTPLFSNLSLGAGTYYLVMALTLNSISGAVWSATQLPVVTAVPGTFVLPSLTVLPGNYNVSTPARSVFSPNLVNGIATSLQFSLSGDPATSGPPVQVPEPSSALLLLTGLALFSRFRR